MALVLHAGHECVTLTRHRVRRVATLVAICELTKRGTSLYRANTTILYGVQGPKVVRLRSSLRPIHLDCFAFPCEDLGTFSLNLCSTLAFASRSAMLAKPAGLSRRDCVKLTCSHRVWRAGPSWSLPTQQVESMCEVRHDRSSTSKVARMRGEAVLASAKRLGAGFALFWSLDSFPLPFIYGLLA